MANGGSNNKPGLSHPRTASRQTYHARCCPELDRRTGARFVYFPGAHNCASDLPAEFAALVAGILDLAKR